MMLRQQSGKKAIPDRNGFFIPRIPGSRVGIYVKYSLYLPILKPVKKAKRMKMFTKLTLTAALLIGFLFNLNAQTVGKAAWMIGGSASLDIVKPKDVDATTTWQLNPNLGYFFADDLAIGLGLSLFDLGEGFDTQASVGPFVRYYITDPIFIQAGANFELNEGGGTSFGAAVGYSWFLNDGVAIEPALYFQSYNNDGDAFDFSQYGLSIGIQAFANHNHGM